MQFKKGAFVSSRPCKPVALDYQWSMFNPAYDIVPFFPLAFMTFSLFGCGTIFAIELPTFVPNDYLYTTHSNKGTDKWEIYAWAVREIIADAGNFEKSDLLTRNKMRYEQLLGIRDPFSAEEAEVEPLIKKDDSEI